MNRSAGCRLNGCICLDWHLVWRKIYLTLSFQLNYALKVNDADFVKANKWARTAAAASQCERFHVSVCVCLLKPNNYPRVPYSLTLLCVCMLLSMGILCTKSTFNYTFSLLKCIKRESFCRTMATSYPFRQKHSINKWLSMQCQSICLFTAGSRSAIKMKQKHSVSFETQKKTVQRCCCHCSDKSFFLFLSKLEKWRENKKEKKTKKSIHCESQQDEKNRNQVKFLVQKRQGKISSTNVNCCLEKVCDCDWNVQSALTWYKN